MEKTNIELFKIWAPDDALWTDWAKPVVFMGKPRGVPEALHLPDVRWLAAADYTSMVIVDLPGSQGVTEGLALARMGYRPVPLYNGVNAPYGAGALVDVEPILGALVRGADEIERLNLRHDAPPVFMLDADRLRTGGKQAGKFDNRWCIFPQDMPSAVYLEQRGIKKVFVRSDNIRNDLAHILRRYADRGIKIYLCGEVGAPVELSVVKPSRFKSLAYRMSVIVGLTRGAAGGFGGQIPEPTESSGGGVHYYGRIG